MFLVVLLPVLSCLLVCSLQCNADEVLRGACLVLALGGHLAVFYFAGGLRWPLDGYPVMLVGW